MKRCRILLITFHFLLLAFFGCSSKERTLVVFHTSDIHGYIAAREAGSFHPENPQRLIGGFAALKNLVKKEKGPYLLLDSGDIFFGGAPEGTLTKGEAVAELMNELGYTAAALGNHEFDFSESLLKKLAAKLKFPLLSANTVLRHPTKKMKEDPNLKPPYRPEYVRPYIVQEIPELGVKVGIFGLTTTATPFITIPKNVSRLHFLRPVNVAKRMVEILRNEEGCQIVIALSHIGIAPEGQNWEDEKYLASQVEGIDVILGGHFHLFWKDPYRDSATGTLVIQSGRYLSAATRLEFTLDEQGKIKRTSSKLVDLWVDELGEDEQVLSMVRRYQQEVDKKLSEQVAEAAEEIPHQGSDSPMSNMVADAMREFAASDIGIQNLGGTRSGLKKGPVTLKDVFAICPFPNTVVTLQMSGQDVMDLLEKMASGGNDGPGLSLSGIQVHMDERRPKGHRVLRVTVGGKPLAVAKTYRVTTNSFLAEGGENYGVLRQAREKEDSGRLMRDVLSDYFRKHTPLRAPSGGRIVRKNR